MQDVPFFDCPVAKIACQWPDRVAIQQDDCWTYRRLDHAIQKRVQELRHDARFLACGKKLVIDPKDPIEAIVSMWAVLRLGGQVLCVSKHHSVSEVSRYRDLFLAVDLVGPATVIATSGSSGTPKLAVHRVEVHLASATSFVAAFGLCQTDCWWLNLPLYHVGGLSVLYRIFSVGGSVSFALTKELTHLSIVPAQIPATLNLLSECPPDHLKMVLVGGSRVSEAELSQLLQADMPVYLTYGLTEMSSQVATSQVLDVADVAVPHLKVLPGCQVRIAEDGEVWVRGDMLFDGYITEGDVVCPTTPSGWFQTGDLAEKQGDFLKILGRKDFMIVSGGENIQPEEVESALMAVPGIAQAVVVGVPDDTYGERPVAFLSWEGPAKPLSEVKEILSEKIARFKCPDALYELDPFLTDQLKVDRAALRRASV